MHNAGVSAAGALSLAGPAGLAKLHPDTPSLVLDLEAFGRNVARMAGTL